MYVLHDDDLAGEFLFNNPHIIINKLDYATLHSVGWSIANELMNSKLDNPDDDFIMLDDIIFTAVQAETDAEYGRPFCGIEFVFEYTEDKDRPNSKVSFVVYKTSKWS